MCACGNQTQKSIPMSDSVATPEEVTANENMEAEDLPDFVARVYSKVNEVWSQKEVHTDVLDSAFFAKSYNDLRRKVLEVQDDKPFDEMFFIEYMPFSQGLVVPISISDIKADMLADGTAEVSFEIKDKEDAVKMWWHLVSVSGAWRIDNWKNDPEDEKGMADRMREYLKDNE